VERARHDARIYGINETKYLKTIQGESNWNPKAVGDGKKAYGIAQFHKPTFTAFARLCGYSNASYTDTNTQLAVMACAFANGLAHHWTVYRNLK
jgi:hypothetical protein